MEKIITIEGLKKSYGKVEAVKGVDFYVEKGSLFAFLGPNGAGKSTTIDILCTLLQPDGGSVEIGGRRLGREDDKIRSSIGVVFQEGLLDSLLTVRENLITRGSLYGPSGNLRRAADDALAAVGAKEFSDRPYGKLSGGQKRRADIARALVHTPEILFLDEPTTGLDPQTRKSVWETVRKLQRERGITVFLTTHYMEEAANADYVTVIDRGEITAKGTPAELKARYSSDTLKLKSSRPEELAARLQQKGFSYRLSGGVLSVPLAKTMDALPLLNEFSGEFEHFEVIGGTMDDAFIQITGEGIRES